MQGAGRPHCKELPPKEVPAELLTRNRSQGPCPGDKDLDLERGRAPCLHHVAKLNPFMCAGSKAGRLWARALAGAAGSGSGHPGLRPHSPGTECPPVRERTRRAERARPRSHCWTGLPTVPSKPSHHSGSPGWGSAGVHCLWGKLLASGSVPVPRDNLPPQLSFLGRPPAPPCQLTLGAQPPGTCTPGGLGAARLPPVPQG